MEAQAFQDTLAPERDPRDYLKAFAREKSQVGAVIEEDIRADQRGDQQGKNKGEAVRHGRTVAERRGGGKGYFSPASGVLDRRLMSSRSQDTPAAR